MENVGIMFPALDKKLKIFKLCARNFPALMQHIDCTRVETFPALRRNISCTCSHVQFKFVLRKQHVQHFVGSMLPTHYMWSKQIILLKVSPQVTFCRKLLQEACFQHMQKTRFLHIKWEWDFP